MWAFLASESLLFAGLFALYASYRVMYPVEFAEAVARNDLTLGTINTAVLITSSLAVALAVHAARIGRQRRAAMLLLGAIFAGLLFLIIKGTEYAAHVREGIVPGEGYANTELGGFGHRAFFTVYYLATGLHALHVIAGMGMLAVVGWRALSAGDVRRTGLHVELVGLYWHLVDLVWILLWPLLYLAKG